MNFRFPLDNVKISVVSDKRIVENPLYDDGFFSVNDSEISVDIQDIAQYHISNGNAVQVYSYKNADPLAVEHMLNNWAVVGILHQRKILNFHASAFSIDGNGIMVCGDSGAGKSSLTAVASLNGAKFLSDDITTITFKNAKPKIMNLPCRLALREETLTQLNMGKHHLVDINPLNRKSLFDFTHTLTTPSTLKHILWITVHEKDEPKITELTGMDKFTMLRGEICGWDMLKGMKDTERIYLYQLLEISRKIKITKVSRPKQFPIRAFTDLILGYLQNV